MTLVTTKGYLLRRDGKEVVLVSVSDVMKPALTIVELAIAVKRAEEDYVDATEQVAGAEARLRVVRAMFNDAVHAEIKRRLEAGDET